MSSFSARWPALAALLVCAVVPAACGGGGEAKAASGAQAPPEKATSSTAPAAQVPASQAQGSSAPVKSAAAPAQQAARESKAATPPAGQAPKSAPAAKAPAAPAPASAPATAKTQPAAKQPSRAAVDALSDADLLQRKDLWPKKVAFREIARLDATTWWKAGEELPLKDWDGVNVILDEGTFLFDMPAQKTDVVERTRNEAAALSPEAFALTLPKLRERPELWPTRLAIASTLQFGDNTIVPAGREVTLRFFEGDQLAVWDREVNNDYTVDPQETDLLARSRAVLELPAEQRTPFFLRSLAATLDKPEGEGAARLAKADYVVVYSGRLGCGRCAQFLPELKDFYSKNPSASFQVVFLSNDPDAQSAQRYLAESQPPGVAIRFDRRYEAANLLALPLQVLPGMFVFDRNGKLLERNDPNAGAPSANEVLASFQTKLAQAAPK
jgi:Thioredoxin-like